MSELSIKQYHFDIELAVKYGVDESIFLNNLIFWIEKNKANNLNFKNNYYWTFNTQEAYCKLFPFWTKRQLQRIIKSLQDSKVIKIKQYNKNQYNRTNWYTIIDKNIMQNGIKHDTKPCHEAPQMGKCINTYSKQHIENLSSKEDNSDSKESQVYYLKNDDILNTLKIIIPLGFKQHKIPDTIKEPISKTIDKCQKFILALINNKFSSLYNIDKTWLKKFDIKIPKIRNYTHLIRLLKKSINGLNDRRKEEYEPEDKNSLPKTLESFFFNFTSRKSMFLKYLTEEPVLRKEFYDKTNAKKVIESLSTEITAKAVRLKRDGWNELKFWKAIRNMYKWYEENTTKLREFNYKISDECGYNYKAEAGTFNKLLKLYNKYTGTWQIFNVGSFGMDNKVWPLFIEWVWKKQQISLDFTKRKNPDYESDVEDMYNQDIEVVF